MALTRARAPAAAREKRPSFLPRVWPTFWERIMDMDDSLRSQRITLKD
jgi:hypothetical protein